MPPKPKTYRIGEVNHNTYGSEMTIIKYNGRCDILVRFQDGYETTSTYSRFIVGEIENPYDKSVSGIGYLGEGIYNILKYTKTKRYTTWRSMLQRCYDDKYHSTRPTYIDCIVCEEWHNYQIFAKWYDQNIYNVQDQRMELDKDILIKGNKVYSPETCVFVPNSINSLFIKSNAKRGEYPIGVSWHSRNNKYMSSGKDAYLGYYNTSKEAFEAYKKWKESLIKQMADKYKDKLPQKLYDAMYKYEVEITD